MHYAYGNATWKICYITAYLINNNINEKCKYGGTSIGPTSWNGRGERAAEAEAEATSWSGLSLLFFLPLVLVAGPWIWGWSIWCCTLVVVAALVFFEVESESAGLGSFSLTRCSFHADIRGLLLWPSLHIGFRNFLLHLHLLHNQNHNHNVNLFSLNFLTLHLK